MTRIEWRHGALALVAVKLGAATCFVGAQAGGLFIAPESRGQFSAADEALALNRARLALEWSPS